MARSHSSPGWAIAHLFEARNDSVVFDCVAIFLCHGPHVIDEELITLLLRVHGLARLGANTVHEGMALREVPSALGEKGVSRSQSHWRHISATTWRSTVDFSSQREPQLKAFHRCTLAAAGRHSYSYRTGVSAHQFLATPAIDTRPKPVLQSAQSELGVLRGGAEL